MILRCSSVTNRAYVSRLKWTCVVLKSRLSIHVQKDQIIMSTYLDEVSEVGRVALFCLHDLQQCMVERLVAVLALSACRHQQGFLQSARAEGILRFCEICRTVERHKGRIDLFQRGQR